jgi:hypothetical protein
MRLGGDFTLKRQVLAVGAVIDRAYSETRNRFSVVVLVDSHFFLHLSHAGYIARGRVRELFVHLVGNEAF